MATRAPSRRVGSRVPAARVEEPPELLAAPLPVYPERMRQARIEGPVVLEVIVDTTGLVRVPIAFRLRR